MTPYNCRHTFITNAIRCGVNQLQLQKMVGYVDEETTKTYEHLNVDDLRNEVKKITTSLTVYDKLVTQQNRPQKRSQKSS